MVQGANGSCCTPPFPSIVTPSFSLILFVSLSLVFLRPSLVFICFICTVSKTVESTRRVSNGERKKKRGGERVVKRGRNKNAGNRRGISCRAHYFTACAGLRSCMQQDFARISFLTVSVFLPIPFSRSFLLLPLRRILLYPMSFHRFRMISFYTFFFGDTKTICQWACRSCINDTCVIL